MTSENYWKIMVRILYLVYLFSNKTDRASKMTNRLSLYSIRHVIFSDRLFRVFRLSNRLNAHTKNSIHHSIDIVYFLKNWNRYGFQADLVMKSFVPFKTRAREENSHLPIIFTSKLEAFFKLNQKFHIARCRYRHEKKIRSYLTSIENVIKQHFSTEIEDTFSYSTLDLFPSILF